MMLLLGVRGGGNLNWLETPLLRSLSYIHLRTSRNHVVSRHHFFY